VNVIDPVARSTAVTMTFSCVGKPPSSVRVCPTETWAKTPAAAVTVTLPAAIAACAVYCSAVGA